MKKIILCVWLMASLIVFTCSCGKAAEPEDVMSEYVVYEEIVDSESEGEAVNSEINNTSENKKTSETGNASSSSKGNASTGGSNTSKSSSDTSNVTQTPDKKDETKPDTTVSETAAQLLKGIRVSAIGDSYFAGNNLGKDSVWLRIFADKYGISLNNYGINGSTISDYVTKFNPICQRYSSMEGQSDIVIFEGGHNDFCQNVPLGEMESRDTKTFCGALNTVMDGLSAKYPDALILGVTPWYVNERMKVYSDRMLSVCAARGIKCFNAADQRVTGVYMNDVNFRDEYCQSINDSAHLNLKGSQLVEPAFEKFIADAYLAFKTAG